MLSSLTSTICWFSLSSLLKSPWSTNSSKDLLYLPFELYQTGWKTLEAFPSVSIPAPWWSSLVSCLFAFGGKPWLVCSHHCIYYLDPSVSYPLSDLPATKYLAGPPLIVFSVVGFYASAVVLKNLIEISLLTATSSLSGIDGYLYRSLYPPTTILKNMNLIKKLRKTLNFFAIIESNNRRFSLECSKWFYFKF